MKKNKKKMGKLTISHRSTAYPCSVPGLGRLAGAGRIGLTHGESTKMIQLSSKKVYFHEKFSWKNRREKTSIFIEMIHICFDYFLLALSCSKVKN